MRSFNSFESFAAHLAGIIAAIDAAQTTALKAAAVHVEKVAKAKIGEYQESAGPFVGWAVLAPSTLAEKERLGFSPPDNPLLRTGALRDSISHHVETFEAQIGSNSDIAVYQELGTRSMPPRSFLGATGIEEAPKVVAIISAGIDAALGG